MPNPTPRATTLVRIAAVVIVLEALVFVVLAVLDLADLSSARLGVGVGAAIFLAFYGLAQVAAAALVLRWRSWARGPLVLTQLIQLGIAWNMRHSDPRVVAALLAAASVVVLGCLLAPAVTRALIDDPPV